MTRLTLPLPPCVNKLWRGDRTGRRWLDPAAARFKQTAAVIALQQGVRATLDDVEVHVEFRCTRPRDIDAGLKVLLDAMSGIAWVDDRQVKRLAVEIDPAADEDRCDVVFGPYRKDPLRVSRGEPWFGEFRRKVESALRRA